MSLLSSSFLLLLLGTLILYYLVPKKHQWVILLLASTVFYLAAGVRSFFYLLTTSVTVYAATRLMQRISDGQKAYFKENKPSREEKAVIRKQNGAKRKAILIAALAVNLGLLCVFKYFHFALEQFNALAGIFGGSGIRDTFQLIVPLGISFYTFQSIGYLADVYWEYYKPEKNYFRVLLFVSFFPQITQGPISSFETLAPQLAGEHEAREENLFRGFQRMLWGFMKKMVIANTLAPCAADVFAYYREYAGISVLIGAFLYIIQLYADFSGYMDIMCGFCEMLDIRLTENFNRPFFSKSISEYWRRWHISLGQWFKKYVYYPIGMSSWSRKLAKNTRERFGEHFANSMPATIGLLATWFATGLWHGASWAYISWGLMNGLFIILSLWLAPVYAACKRALRINDQSRAWRCFQIIRTFTLVTLLEVLPEVGTLRDGLGLWMQIFTNHRIPTSLGELLPFVQLSNFNIRCGFAVAVFCAVLLFVSSVMQRKKPIREYFGALPVYWQVILLSGLLMLIATIGVQASWGTEGFMYANF